MGDATIDSNAPSSPSTMATSLEAGPLEPIAIIGLSCRFPDGASDPQKLWKKLETGFSAWSKGPGGRFNMEAFHDPDNSHASSVSFVNRHLFGG